jgi:predicted XRE-type DNA-binding protein
MGKPIATSKRRSPEIATVAVQRDSGNVFADLNLPEAVELDTKVQLVVAINRQIKNRSLSQVTVARLFGVNQPKVSVLKNYKLGGFSVERLMTFLTALGSDIEIRMRSHGGRGDDSMVCTPAL